MGLPLLPPTRNTPEPLDARVPTVQMRVKGHVSRTSVILALARLEG